MDTSYMVSTLTIENSTDHFCKVTHYTECTGCPHKSRSLFGALNTWRYND